jgi:Uma2 family endonuclease
MNSQPTTLAAPPGPITVEQWAAMEMPPFYELVDGRLQELPEVALWQDVLLIKFTMFISVYIEQHNLGYLAGPTSPLRISALRGRMPDLFLIPPDQMHRAGRNAFHGVPPFAVEVLSPSTEQIDRTDKRDEYALLGIGHYWMIDFPNRAIEVYELRGLPGGERAYVLTETVKGDVAFRPLLFPGLEIPLARVWPTAFENPTEE